MERTSIHVAESHEIAVSRRGQLRSSDATTSLQRRVWLRRPTSLLGGAGAFGNRLSTATGSWLGSGPPQGRFLPTWWIPRGVSARTINLGRSLVTEERREQVKHDVVEVLDMLHVVGRYDYCDVAERPHPPSIRADESDSSNP